MKRIEKKVAELDAVIRRNLKKKKEKEKKLRDAERASDKEDREFWKKEEKLLPQKKRLYADIIAWRNKFAKSKQFENVLDAIEDDHVEIYGTCGWGHRKNYSGRDQSRVILWCDGALEYSAWTSAIGGGYNQVYFKFGEAGKTARKLTYDYLKKLHAHITDGEVYKTIAAELKDRC